MSTIFFALGALLGALSVAMGAIGAHALKGRLSEAKLITFETGVRYQFYHSLALLVVGLASATWETGGLLVAAGWLFLIGVVLFSGSLYWLAFGGPRWLGPITPLGGLALIAGWVLLAAVAL